jgi:hypothetical protein
MANTNLRSPVVLYFKAKSLCNQLVLETKCSRGQKKWQVLFEWPISQKKCLFSFIKPSSFMNKEWSWVEKTTVKQQICLFFFFFIENYLFCSKQQKMHLPRICFSQHKMFPEGDNNFCIFFPTFKAGLHIQFTHAENACVLSTIGTYIQAV